LDEFFQNLREIQKKERNLSSLSPVGDDFYHQISNYFNRLMERIDNNPFSFESYLLRDAQRIVVEICERREHKISNSAVMNVQRSYQLFKGVHENGRPNIPLNSTPEEEKLYLELYRSLAAYREEMRSPLRSYTNKKDHKLNSSHPSSKRIFKPPETVEGDFKKETPESKAPESKAPESKAPESKAPESKAPESKAPESKAPESKVSTDDVSTGTPISKEIKAPLDVDEIPPEIQDEIYRQFGREPSRQSSQESSASISSSGKNQSENIKKVSSNSVSFEGKPEINPVQSSKHSSGVSKASTEVLMILDELPSIMGVDRKVYGPFYPGDVITMPEANARILIKNHKGKSIQRYK
jgi:DNA replication factor GINS